MSLKIKTSAAVKPMVQEQDDSQVKNKPSKKDRVKEPGGGASLGPVDYGKVTGDEDEEERITRYLEATMHQKKLRMEQEKIEQEKRKEEMLKAYLEEEKKRAEEEEQRRREEANKPPPPESMTTTSVQMTDPLKLNISHSTEMKQLDANNNIIGPDPSSPRSNRKALPQTQSLRGGSPPRSTQPSRDSLDHGRDEKIGSEHLMGKIDNDTLEASLMFLKSLPNVNKLAGSTLISDLMKSYLPVENKSKPTAIVKPQQPETETNKSGSIGEQLTAYERVDELDKDVQRKTQKKQPPPPPRPKTRAQRSWVDPREHQRLKVKTKAWPPVQGPDDRDCYVVEGYGQTDPYSQRLIKDIQKEKRAEQEAIEAAKRSEVVEENLQPVKNLRDAFSHKPKPEKPGVLKPEAVKQKDTEWIKHKIPTMDYQAAPDEPTWMNLIRCRRWKSTVRARFPCDIQKDKIDFERRSTTPRNWKKLVKDKNAMRMLSEIVGMGPEGEELFQKLAVQKNKLEDDEKALDRQTEEELLAYEIARDSLGIETLQSIQKNSPLPGGRQKTEGDESEVSIPSNVGAAYPFTTSQLEAAFLSEKLLKLHPEEFRKLMSMERCRNASLRWQFSADPFDSVHEHQEIPYEIALLASEEPRVRQAMKKYLQSTGSAYGSGYNSASHTPRRTQSERGYNSDMDGYESAGSVTSADGDRGRERKKKGPPPKTKPKPRGRSMSPATGMMKMERPKLQIDAAGNLALPKAMENYSEPSSRDGKTLRGDAEEDAEVHAHGFLSDAELQLSKELADMEEMTRKIRAEVEEDLAKINIGSLETRQEIFLNEVKKTEEIEKTGASEAEEIDKATVEERKQALQSQLPAAPAATEEKPKIKHQVRKIDGDAQLNQIFRKRREAADASAVDGAEKKPEAPEAAPEAAP